MKVTKNSNLTSTLNVLINKPPHDPCPAIAGELRNSPPNDRTGWKAYWIPRGSGGTLQ